MTFWTNLLLNSVTLKMKAASSSQLPEQTYSTQCKPQTTFTSATFAMQFNLHPSQNLHSAVLNYALKETLEA
jgi:hypothetical protein